MKGRKTIHRCDVASSDQSRGSEFNRWLAHCGASDGLHGSHVQVSLPRRNHFPKSFSRDRSKTTMTVGRRLNPRPEST